MESFFLFIWYTPISIYKIPLLLLAFFGFRKASDIRRANMTDPCYDCADYNQVGICPGFTARMQMEQVMNEKVMRIMEDHACFESKNSEIEKIEERKKG